MSWACRMIDHPHAEMERVGFIAPGSMWFYPEGLRTGSFYEQSLSDAYRREHAGRRPPIMVRLPGGDEFCIDSRAWRQVPHPCDHAGNYRVEDRGCPTCQNRGSFAKLEFFGAGWSVTGTEPLLTMQPSIDVPRWHGYITKGVIGADQNGRRYDANGKGLL